MSPGAMVVIPGIISNKCCKKRPANNVTVQLIRNCEYFGAVWGVSKKCVKKSALFYCAKCCTQTHFKCIFLV